MQYDSTWVEDTLHALTLEERIGQLLMPAIFNTEEASIAGMEAHLKRTQAGGLFVMRGDVEGLATGIPRLAQATRIPLLMASDFESGLGHIMKCGTRFPRPMCRGRKGSARDDYEMGRITAEEGRAIGFQVTFSPVLDLNTDPLNPDVNVRAYGEDLRTVTRLGLPHIRGLQEHGMLACPKHFPGNGGTSMDPHLSPAVVNTPAARYRKNWLEAYRRAFSESQPASLMAGFITVPSIMTEREPRTGTLLPAGLSRQMLVDVLRGELGFDGLVISDALNMGGANSIYPRNELAGRAVAAGCDMLLCFAGGGDVSPEAASIRAALDAGWLTAARLDEAVRRVLVAKSKAGLDKVRTTSLGNADAIRRSFKKHDVLNARTLRKGLTVLSNSEGTLPLRDLAGKRILMINTYSPVKEEYFNRHDSLTPDYLADGLRARGAEVEQLELTESCPANSFHQAIQKAAAADQCFINLFIVPSYAIGTLLPPKEAVRAFYAGILTVCKVSPIITAFGDPYVRQLCHTGATFLCTFDDSRASLEAALSVWCGEQPARGRMPVSLAGIFRRGDGVDVG